MKVFKTLPRVYVKNLNSAIPFYEELYNTKANMRFKMPVGGLELAQVGDILIISGNEDDLKMYRNTLYSLLVDSIEEYKIYLEKAGASIIRGPKQVPTGINMTVKHPDGSIVEYVEHNKSWMEIIY